MAEARRLILVDGSGYLFRAYHVMGDLTRPDGTPVGAVYGFCNMLMKLFQEVECDSLAVIFDASGKSFRNEIFVDYKANRPPAPQDLVPQFPLVREATRAFGLPAVEMKGFEADDLIATYAEQAHEAGWEVEILSNDKDMMQLVGGKVRMCSPVDFTPVGTVEVEKKFGVSPDKVIDVQALAGDSSDNIPGVPGIGVKIAAELVLRFGSLEGVLKGASEVSQPKRRERLLKHADDARMSYTLATLRRDVPVKDSLDSFARRAPDPEVLRTFLSEQNFGSLLRRAERSLLRSDTLSSPSSLRIEVPEEGSYEIVDTIESLDIWIERAQEAGIVAVGVETDFPETYSAPVGIALASVPGQACYIPLGHRAEGGGDADLFACGPNQLPAKSAFDRLRDLLEDPGVLKVGMDLKRVAGLFRFSGSIDLSPWDDVMLISFVLDAGRQGHSLDSLSKHHLGVDAPSYDDVCGKGKKRIPFSRVELEAARDYAAKNADLALQLHSVLRPRLLRERLVSVYETIERPLVPVIAGMELEGIAIDRRALGALSKDFSSRLVEIEREIHELAGRPFKIASPKQLGEVLFDEMKIAPRRMTKKSGRATTEASVLEDLAAEGHELPARVLAWRQIAKLKGTYVDALLKHSEGSGRVHTSFHITGAVTGRFSSNEPNLQNIPVRTQEGRRIRKAFIAPKGYVLVCADYSQIELRLLAEVAGIESLRRAFAEGSDIHALTAERVFGSNGTGDFTDLRRRAKAINFGIIYGLSAFGLARQIDVTQKEAQEYIDIYFETYPGLREYMDLCRESAREMGFVTTLFGRRIHIPDIKGGAPGRRGHAERQAINAPLQGTAADIIKRAMVRIPDALAKAKLSSRMLLQVHDELVFEAPVAEAEKTGEVAMSVMREAALPSIDLSVSLVVDVGIGSNWDEAH